MVASPPPARVHAIVPWALLDTLRRLDVPSADDLAEYPGELAAKRLGLSATVAAQISRYRTLAGRDGRVAQEEVVGLLRLVARRNDAALLFSDAGRQAAELGMARVPASAQRLWRMLPPAMRHRFGRLLAAHLLARVFDVVLERDGGRLVASARRSPSVAAIPDGSACQFYGSAVAGVLGAFTDFEGAILHDSCAARGASQCRWHTSAAA